jgi:hypothetical protein
VPTQRIHDLDSIATDDHPRTTKPPPEDPSKSGETREDETA